MRGAQRLVDRWALALLVLATLGPRAIGAEQEPTPPAAPASADEASLPDVEALIAQLGDPRFEVRERATEALLALGPRVRPALERAARESPDPEIRYRARYILRADLRRVSAWIDQLSRPTRGRLEQGRPDIMPRLLALGVRAVDPLVRLLRAELEAQRPALGRAVLICDVLERLARPEAVPPLVALLDLDLYTVDARLARVLLASDPDAALEALTGRVDDARARVRRNVARLLGYFADKRADKAIAPLVQLANDPDPTVRKAALEGLVRAGEAPSVRSVVLERLADPVQEVRTAAVQAAGQLRIAEAAEPLRRIAREAQGRNDDLLLAAVRALGQLRDRDAVEALTGLLSYRNVRVAAEAAESLGRLRAREAVPGLIALLDRPEPMAQAAALRALGRIRDPAGFSAVKAYYARRGVYRPLALAAIARFRTAESDAFLVERALATDQDAEVHVVLDALLYRRPDQVQRVALAASNRRGVGIRSRAALLLGRGPATEEVVQRLRALATTDPSPQVRLAAIEAVGALGCKELAPALEKRIDNETVEVRRQIVRTLARLGRPERLAAEVAAKRARLARANRLDPSLASELALDLLYLGRYEQAAGQLETIVEQPGVQPAIARVAAYNLACARARQGRSDAALAALEQAIDLGFRDWRHLAQDFDLDSLRDLPGYRRLIRRARGDRAKRYGAGVYFGIPDALFDEDVDDGAAGDGAGEDRR